MNDRETIVLLVVVFGPSVVLAGVVGLVWWREVRAERKAARRDRAIAAGRLQLWQDHRFGGHREWL